MVGWKGSNHIPNIYLAKPGNRFISIEPTSRIRLKDIEKCPAQSDPHKRITPLTFWKKTRKTRFDWKQDEKTAILYKLRCHGLEKVNWCDENKILRPEQNIRGRRHPIQLSRERTSRNETRTHHSQHNVYPYYYYRVN